MNGRVYDPEIGRFLSADPFVQAPETTQSFNRYSYVDNNPLSATDPSGFFLKKIFKAIGKFLKTVLPALVTIFVVAAVCLGSGGLGCGPALWAGVGAIAGGTMAFVTTMSYGGSLSDALTGAAITAGTAIAFYGIGEVLGHATAGFLTPQHIAKTVAHGLVGGVESELRGGKFTSGLLAGGFTQFASPGIGGIAANDNTVGAALARTVAAAVVGGTASELGGGKFANGAVTGAFSRFFNDEGAGAGIIPTEDGGADVTSTLGVSRIADLDAASLEALELMGYAVDVAALPVGVSKSVGIYVGHRLSRLTRAAVREVDTLGAAALTPRQRAAILRHPQLRAAYRGSAIDSRVRSAANRHPFLRRLVTGRPNRGPDFTNRVTQVTFDMTTTRAFPAHQRRYGAGLRLLETDP
jgi:hypothetical protein